MPTRPRWSEARGACKDAEPYADAMAQTANTTAACKRACNQLAICASFAMHLSGPTTFRGIRSQCWLSPSPCFVPDCCHKHFATFAKQHDLYDGATSSITSTTSSAAEEQHHVHTQDADCLAPPDPWRAAAPVGTRVLTLTIETVEEAVQRLAPSGPFGKIVDRGQGRGRRAGLAAGVRLARMRALWSTLSPGGFYVIEEVGAAESYGVSLAVRAWMEALVINLHPWPGMQGPSKLEAAARLGAQWVPPRLSYAVALPAGAVARKAAANIAEASSLEVEFTRAAWPKDGHRSDKVGAEHNYAPVYSARLLPMRADGRLRRFLEIGLGCDFHTARNATSGEVHNVFPAVSLWRTLLPPSASWWEAEYNSRCVEDARSRGLLDGVHVLTGDQADPTVLARWVRQTGGDFSAIVDDGGHHNSQIMASLGGLWPQLHRGGVYFIEDLHVSRSRAFDDLPSFRAVDHVGALADLLIARGPRGRRRAGAAGEPAAAPAGDGGADAWHDFVGKADAWTPGVSAVLCQLQACALSKAC